MKYTVIWKPSAQNELAKLWMEAKNRNRVRSAADKIDALLKIDPSSRGESRGGFSRILFVPPLAVHFTVSEPDRTVTVLAVWSFSHEAN
jgi:mRNA-degrading endonuclease RelE of RelBE toxin-antitoxin system